MFILVIKPRFNWVISLPEILIYADNTGITLCGTSHCTRATVKWIQKTNKAIRKPTAYLLVSSCIVVLYSVKFLKKSSCTVLLVSQNITKFSNLRNKYHDFSNKVYTQESNGFKDHSRKWQPSGKWSIIFTSSDSRAIASTLSGLSRSSWSSDWLRSWSFSIWFARMAARHRGTRKHELKTMFGNRKIET